MNPDKNLKDFAKAMGQFKQALQLKAENNVVRAGCIQYFEFTFELAWKAIKAIAQDHGLACGSPKSCLRIAFSQGWIQEEQIWLDMLSARNLMSHTYDTHDALAVYDSLPGYVSPFELLLTQLMNA